MALLAAEPAALTAAAAHLTKAGYPLEFCICAPPEAAGVLAEAAEAAGLGLSEAGDGRSRRLWRASPCLMAALPLVEARLLAAAPAATSEPEPEPEPEREPEPSRAWTALDLGCGSGRDCVWLAQRSRWRAIGVDHLPKMLQRFELLAAHAR